METPAPTRRSLVWVWGGMLFLLGCTTTRPEFEPLALPSLPKAHEVRSGQCVIISDQPCSAQHPLLRSIETLPDEICRELQLPSCQQVIMVYLFADRQRYEAYMHCQFPELPNRRAFFIAHSDPRRGDELCIYTYWGEQLQEDLRHELTHATLHSVLRNVPMWLDEGLAEFFESPRNTNGLHATHLKELAFGNELADPTWPPLECLEKLTAVQYMTTADYRASWGIVYWLLRATPQGRAALLHYLQRLRGTDKPPPFKPQLQQVLPQFAEAVRDHMQRLRPVVTHHYAL